MARTHRFESFFPVHLGLLAFTIQSSGLQTLQGGIEDPNDMASETLAQLLLQVSAGEPMCPSHSSFLAVSLSAPGVQAVCCCQSHPEGMACGVFPGGGSHLTAVSRCAGRV
jgi:hypothetical protein